MAELRLALSAGRQSFGIGGFFNLFLIALRPYQAMMTFAHAAMPLGTILEFLKENSDAIQALQALVTSLAFVVGGVSAYLAFGRKREKFPRAKLVHGFEVIPIDGNSRVLRVRLEIENLGDTLLEIHSALNRVQQVFPLADTNAGRFCPASSDAEPEIQWPMIAERNATYPPSSREIEPKESDEQHFDYILGPEVEVVVIYSYVQNAQKKRRLFSKAPKEIGWMKTETVHLDSALIPLMSKPKNSGQTETRQGAPKAQPSQTANTGAGSAQGVAKPAPDTVATPKTR